MVTGVNGSSNDPAEGVPGSVVKPVMKAVEAFLRQVFGGSEVEVGIELVNDALEPQHCEQPRREGCEERERGGGGGGGGGELGHRG